ncbi:MAG: ribokinase [Candidatus Alcyoniella australis]|nr:ribokinase [Candidatus Alcyoniella australis]
MDQPRICVVGACNIDLISYVPRLPVLGETLHGERFAIGFGGKGANQAAMAAKLGAAVSMVAKLGRDTFGEDTLANFKRLGIDTRHVVFTDQAFSGVAPIAVDAQGNNSIIIVTGANDLLTVDEVEAARDVIAASQVLVCQLESPLEISLAALRIAREHGVTTIFNPAPARAELPAECYQLSDVFCPNQSETELLTGLPAQSVEQAQIAARVLLERGAKSVILTLGEHGSLLVTADAVRHVPVQPVRAIDTTGAGDCFVGSLAFFMAAGQPLEEAIRRANTIASISVQSNGTQTSFPDIAQLPPGLIDLQASPDRATISPQQLASYIDHTLLKPDALSADFDRLCDEALRFGFKSVCVNSNRVAQVAKRLANSAVKVCSVIGFPLGAMESAAKAAEARRAVELGATEIDMVINVGDLIAGDLQSVEQDIRTVRDAAPQPIVLKTIIETCLLSDEQKVAACRIAQSAGADFVKTSTGFSSGGATVDDVRLLRATVGTDMGVKASGGIRDTQTALEMIEAGADRIGASAGPAIIKGLDHK